MVKYNKKLAVISTRAVALDLKFPIDIVYYDVDGIFEFYSTLEKYEERQYCVLGLGEMVDIDSSLIELVDMPAGYYAWREDTDSEWIFGEITIKEEE